MRKASKDSWFHFESGDGGRGPVRDEAVISCYLAKIAFVYETRNVWGPRSDTALDILFFGGRAANSRGTYSAAPFTFDVESAKEQIEGKRAGKQGTKWTVDELPVVVVSGEKACLIVGEINSHKPLANYVPLRKKLLSLKDYLLHFEPRSKNSIFRILCKPSLVSPAELPFFVHHSKSGGGSYLLGWPEECKSVADWNLEGVLHLVHRINRNLQVKSQSSR